MDNVNKQPLAEVQTAKMKDCPILTAGRITPLVLQSWSLACKRYMKHADKKPTEIVSFIAEAMLEPRLIAWYQAGQARIDTLTLDQYLEELSKLVLEKNWAHKVRDTIISSKQGRAPINRLEDRARKSKRNSHHVFTHPRTHGSWPEGPARGKLKQRAQNQPPQRTNPF